MDIANHIADPGIPQTTLAKPIFWRFLWKEYRMLRGFWMAVGVLTVIAQVMLSQLAFQSQQVPQMLFAVAWGAAALFAVGGAITLFSAEREERTNELLIHLPEHWQAMFLGKVLLLLILALGLSLTLSVSGCMVAGGVWPSAAGMNQTLRVAGVAIVEATVWGLLFSLLMRQPLLAAILSMGAASLGAQVAVVATSRPNQAFSTTAYGDAAPLRLLLCLAVFLVDLWLAARWLCPEGAAVVTDRLAKLSDLRFGRLRAKSLADTATHVDRPRRTSMLARLLWQTWRESWKTMLAAVLIAGVLMMSVSLTGWLVNAPGMSTLICPLVLPAIFGALVFRADQRGENKQFLVAHAVRPRYVWLARQVVWLSALIAIGAVVQLVGTVFAGYSLGKQMDDSLRYQFYGDGYFQSSWSTAWQMRTDASVYWSIASIGWSSLLAAYGMGQLCSMLLRREVLAGFLALVFAAVLTAWAVIVGLWQLNGPWFVMTIGLAALVATWLRAPDWILGKNKFSTWMKPVCAFAISLAVVLMWLPWSRLAQLPEYQMESQLRYLQESLPASIASWEAGAAEANRAAVAHEQLQLTLVPWEAAIAEVQVDGKRYEEYEFLRDESIRRDRPELGPFAVEAPTTEQKEIQRRFEEERQLEFARQNQEFLDALAQSSEQLFSSPRDGANGWNENYWWGIHGRNETLLINDAKRLVSEDELGKALDRLLVAIRLRGRLLARKTTSKTRESLEWNSGLKAVSESVLNWAQHTGQTKETLKDAIAEIQNEFNRYPEPREAVLGDYFKIRSIVLDQQPPTFLTREKPNRSGYPGYLANQLSWERERALRALEIVTAQDLHYVDAVSYLVDGGHIGRTAKDGVSTSLSSLLQPRWSGTVALRYEPLFNGNWDAFVSMQEVRKQCMSSYLVADELHQRGDLAYFLTKWTDMKVAQRALLTQLALVAYRLDQQEFPETLEELYPDYLPWEVRDPYAGQTFVYHRDGLDLPLYYDVRHRTLSEDLQFKESIPAGTPIFWSVGTNDVVLEQLVAEPQARARWAAPEQEEHSPEAISFYGFRPTSNMFFHPNLIFSLPTD